MENLKVDLGALLVPEVGGALEAARLFQNLGMARVSHFIGGDQTCSGRLFTKLPVNVACRHCFCMMMAFSSGELYLNRYSLPSSSTACDC